MSGFVFYPHSPLANPQKIRYDETKAPIPIFRTPKPQCLSLTGPLTFQEAVQGAKNKRLGIPNIFELNRLYGPYKSSKNQ